MSLETLDLAGIGIGPFNMSVAAHLDGIEDVSAAFFDRKKDFLWHPGLMLPGVQLQNSYLRDLVTAANPTSPWSFLAFLVRHKRFYQFLNCEFEGVYRKETAAYFKWVATHLPSLHFGHDIKDITFANGAFTLHFADTTRTARNLSLGVGTTPSVPEVARPYLSDTCFHSSDIVFKKRNLANKRVAIIGGGQSGCEVFLHLISQSLKSTDSILWFNRRPNLEPLDATAFTNEYFTPEYSERFHGLPADLKPEKLMVQKLASDGASPGTLMEIYRRLYELKHLDGCDADLRLMPGRDVIAMERVGDEYSLVVRNGFDDEVATYTADAVVLATGYTTEIPSFLQTLLNRLDIDAQGRYGLNLDYSVRWDGPAENRIFAVNASRHSHGIADPQMSIAAWRSATIVNALLGRPHFDLELPPSVLQWTTGDSTTATSIAQAAE